MKSPLVSCHLTRQSYHQRKGLFSGQAVTTRLFSQALGPCSVTGYDETRRPSLKPQLLMSFLQPHCSVSPCLDNGGLSKPQFDQLWGKCGETVRCTSLRRGNVKHMKSLTWFVLCVLLGGLPCTRLCFSPPRRTIQVTLRTLREEGGKLCRCAEFNAASCYF